MFNGTLSSDPATAAAEILEIVEHFTVTRYLILVGFVLLIYDHFLTLPEEIEFVWRRPKNMISWIFLCNRYLTPLVLIVDLYDKMGVTTDLTVGVIVSPHKFLTCSTTFLHPFRCSCKTWVVGEIVFHVLSHASIHALVVIRVIALWGGQPLVRWSLYAGWLVYFAITFSIALATGIIHIASFRPAPIINICFSVVGNFVFWVWVPPLILEFALFGLTIVKASKQSHRAITTMPIAYVLYRDGALYFVVICLCSVFNLIVWRWLPISWFALAKYFTLGLVNVMASRMVLNLRQLGGVRNDATPPPTYYAEPVASQVRKDGELAFDARCITSEPQQIHFPDSYNRMASPPRRNAPLPHSFDPISNRLSHKKHQNDPENDPYFYNRQANQLRALKVRRPDFHLTVTPTLPEPGFGQTGSFMHTAEIEEAAAMGAVTPTSAGMRSKRSSITSSKLGHPPGEVYSMQTWSVTAMPLFHAPTRDVEVQINDVGVNSEGFVNQLVAFFCNPVKRKYLQYNKQIIKENSNLRVQVEELKAQISQLYVENLALGRSNIALEKELKREKARRKVGSDPKTINATDKLAADMIKQLETLRQSFARMTTAATPESPNESTPEPIARERPTVSNRINLISRAPEFDNIEEGEELDEDEHFLEPSLIPLPDDDDDLAPRTSPSFSSSPEAPVQPQPTATKRKPTRRQSGLLGPSRTRISLSPDEEDEVAGMLADREEPERASVVPGTVKARKKTKTAEGGARLGLCDVTNSPPKHENIQKGISSVLAEVEEDSNAVLKPTPARMEKSKHKSSEAAQSSKPLTPDPTYGAPHPISTASADSQVDSSEETGGSARPTRARKSVNYAEPKLNTKMRKPDESTPVSYGYPSLPTVPAAKPLKEPSQPFQSTADPAAMPLSADRPIKPLPGSLTKAPVASSQQKTANATTSMFLHTDGPTPRLQSRPKSVQHSLRPSSPVPKSDLSTDDEESEEALSEEEELDFELRKSPKRSASKVLEEFKSASLNATTAVTKPTRIAAPVALMSSHERPPSTSSLHRPTSQSASSLSFQRTNPAAAPTATALMGDLASRKRKAAPIKYQYFDLDSDEDEVVVEGDSEYVPPEQLKVGGSKKPVQTKVPLAHSFLNLRIPSRFISLAATSHPEHESLFHYADGRWFRDEPARLAERYIPFNVNALKAATVAACPGAKTAISIKKTNLGRLYNAVVTTEYVRRAGIPVPQVFAWSCMKDQNDVGAEYIITSKASGIQLANVWSDLTWDQKRQFAQELAHHEKTWNKDLSSSLQALYKDLVLGPSTDGDFWDGERQSMDLDRGPSAKAHYDWTAKYAKPVISSRLDDAIGSGRDPQNHLRLIERSLDVVKFLVPTKRPEIIRPALWHPDLHEWNIFISKSALDSGRLEILSIADWQGAWIRPLYRAVTIPKMFRYHDPYALPNGLCYKNIPAEFDSLSHKEKEAAMANLQKYYQIQTYETNTRALNWDLSEGWVQADQYDAAEERKKALYSTFLRELEDEDEVKTFKAQWSFPPADP
ncbi:Phosphotransferase enzyme [Tulasnella sp. 427]|nr:Phosphotransferase enzyme [Tulasnella sp. 427]